MAIAGGARSAGHHRLSVIVKRVAAVVRMLAAVATEYRPFGLLVFGVKVERISLYTLLVLWVDLEPSENRLFTSPYPSVVLRP